jgi:hypothetical protein
MGRRISNRKKKRHGNAGEKPDTRVW